ncbi:hypothetical protein FQN57_002990 [Myotisia sp. PD_48]|nr:hypothetical protein FQN57_002990 [Myotisia sp. PD_48]
MKPLPFLLALLATTLSPVFAVDDNLLPNEPNGAKGLEKKDEFEDDDSPKETIFNGVKVPPMQEFQGSTLEEGIKDGYWFVKYFSPYCPHCIAVAPVWQTLYEFYYTSNPLLSSTTKQAAGAEKSLNSFHGYYNFHFASVDCVANADKCKLLDIKAFPSFILYRDGKEVEPFLGTKTMEGLSHFVENHLELIRPGSRPPTGIKVPKAGDKEGDMTKPPDNPLSKDKAAVKPDGANPPTEDKTPSTAPPSNPPDAVQKQVEIESRRNSNPEGVSVSLTAESFLKLVTATQDPWFIKFYAPWCMHCQALAPIWAQMARDLAGKLNIGEVNCEVEKRLCKDARVTSYPTMHFFRGGERVEYEGLRGLGDLVNYANKAVNVVGAGVQYVDADAFKKMEATEEVIFLYFFDQATTSEDFMALDRLTLSLVGHARLVKTDSKALAERFRISTWPRLIVSRDGRANYYTALAPKDMRDFRAVLTWMQKVWLPIVPELTAANAREIMEGKYVVLGILNRHRSDEFIQNKRELKNAALEWMEKQTKLFQLERQELRDAKELRIEEADDRNDQRSLRAAKSIRITIKEDDKKQVVFAWVDGIFWDRWIRTTFGIDVKNGERVIIHDEENRRFWDSSPNGVDILPSRTSILETLTHIFKGSNKLKSKSTVGFFEHVFFTVSSFITSHPILFLFLFGAILFFSTVWTRRHFRRPRTGGMLPTSIGGSGGFFHLDGKERGLFGSSGGNNGKVD